MKYDINKDYDTKLQNNLRVSLGRIPLASEVINADTDSALVNETMWQILCTLEKRVAALEDQENKKDKIT